MQAKNIVHTILNNRVLVGFTSKIVIYSTFSHNFTKLAGNCGRYGISAFSDKIFLALVGNLNFKRQTLSLEVWAGIEHIIILTARPNLVSFSFCVRKAKIFRLLGEICG